MHGPGSVVFSFEQYTVCHKSVCPKSYKSFLQSKNISTCLLWFSWWLCTKVPRRCDTDNNVEKVTKLVGLWFCHYGFGMLSQSAPVSRETPCAARDSRLIPNGPPSRCVPVGVMCFMSFILSNLPSMIARICCGFGEPPLSHCPRSHFRLMILLYFLL